MDYIDFTLCLQSTLIISFQITLTQWFSHTKSPDSSRIISFCFFLSPKCLPSCLSLLSQLHFFCKNPPGHFLQLSYLPTICLPKIIFTFLCMCMCYFNCHSFHTTFIYILFTFPRLLDSVKDPMLSLHHCLSAA